MDGDNILYFIYTKNEFKGDMYIGGFKNNLCSGFGEYYWGDGDYEKIDYITGWGVRYLTSNDIYLEGKLIGGFPEGEGYLTYKDEKYKGIYRLNEIRCLFEADNGKAYRCNIVHNKRLNEAIVKQVEEKVHN